MDHSSLRAGDADRRRVADELQRHFVEGRLTSDELKDRVNQSMAARTQGDLDALLRDLPPLPAPASDQPEPIPQPGSPDEAGLWSHRDLRANVSSYALVMLLLVAIWLFTTPGGYFWPIWPMLGWGFAVALHALSRYRR